MPTRKKQGALTAEEKRVVKTLIGRGWRLQDIQALVNLGRDATINSGRITEVKQDKHITPADHEQVAFFELRKRSFDPKTGLNLFDDERLIRAREAMCLAVQLFNSPAYQFKSEMFAVLANIAWTYLLHEFYLRKKVKILNDEGYSLALGQMLKRADCPLSKGMKNNLATLKGIRDAVEHQLLAKADSKWLPLFQACCLNFDKALCDLFGEKLSLSNELGLSLQFAKVDFDQLVTLAKYEIPQKIEALDAQLKKSLTEEELADIEYQFRVIYTLDSASKSRAHVQFINPGTPEAEQIRNVLVKHKLADDFYPYKPGHVVKLVSEKLSKKFTANDHTKAWIFFKVRPRQHAKQPSNTKQEFCVYHTAHNDYTYSQAWLDYLVEQLSSKETWEKIKAVKL